MSPETAKVRTFDTGATRDTDQGKLDYEGSLSPLVLERFAIFMQAHSVLPDGRVRPADNWKRGFPREVYMASLWRHFMELWHHHAGTDPIRGHTENIEESLCALMFNAMGYLHVLLTEADKQNG